MFIMKNCLIQGGANEKMTVAPAPKAVSIAVVAAECVVPTACGKQNDEVTIGRLVIGCFNKCYVNPKFAFYKGAHPTK